MFPEGPTLALTEPHFLSADAIEAMRQGQQTTTKSEIGSIYEAFRTARERALIAEIRRACGVPEPGAAAPAGPVDLSAQVGSMALPAPGPTVQPVTPATAEPPTSLAAIEIFADEKGSGDALRSVLAVAAAHGLYLRPHKYCVVLAPPASHKRAICAVWPQAGRLKVGVWHESIEAFLGVSQDMAKEIMGQDTYRDVTNDNVSDFNDDLKRLMAAGEKTQQP